MKRKRVDKKMIVFGIICLIVTLSVILIWRMRVQGVPVRFAQAVAGNSIVLTDGRTIKLFGVGLANGQENENLANEYLTALLQGKNIWIEEVGGSDWVWVGCESSPKFLWLRKTEENPIGCKKGVLVNNLLIKIDGLFSLKPR